MDVVLDILQRNTSTLSYGQQVLDWLRDGECAAQWKQGMIDCNEIVEFTGWSGPAKEISLRNWESHFYDPDTEMNYENKLYPTAKTEGLKYWFVTVDLMKLYMWTGNKNLRLAASYHFGLALHYLTDMSQPMHACNFTNIFSFRTGQPFTMEHQHLEDMAEKWPMPDASIFNAEIIKSLSSKLVHMGIAVQELAKQTKPLWTTWMETQSSLNPNVYNEHLKPLVLQCKELGIGYTAAILLSTMASIHMNVKPKFLTGVVVNISKHWMGQNTGYSWEYLNSLTWDEIGKSATIFGEQMGDLVCFPYPPSQSFIIFYDPQSTWRFEVLDSGQIGYSGTNTA